MQQRTPRFGHYALPAALALAVTSGMVLLFVWPPAIVAIPIAALIWRGGIVDALCTGRVDRTACWRVLIASVGIAALFLFWERNLPAQDQLQIVTAASSGHVSVDWGSDRTQTIHLVAALVWLMLGIASLSISVRRWHDIGRSGWWNLVALVPIIGPLGLWIMLAFVPGNDGPNRYGPKPSP